jgi:hypothetical protein
VRAALALFAAALTALAACGDARVRSPSAGSTQTTDTATAATYESARWGYSMTVPAGWHRADRPTSATTEPVEILALATYPPRAGNEDCGPLALGGFDADEVLVLILERGLDPSSEWLDFPPRPAHFAFEPGKTSESAECVSSKRQIPLRDHWFNFTDEGRHFHVLVAIGAEALPERAREAYRILDSLRFDRSVKPDWRSSG